MRQKILRQLGWYNHINGISIPESNGFGIASVSVKSTLSSELPSVGLTITPGLESEVFFVGELLLKKFQKMTIIISIVNAKNTNENEVLPSLLVIKPTTTKLIAAIKISNEEVRTTHCDDHFIQEPLASV